MILALETTILGTKSTPPVLKTIILVHETTIPATKSTPPVL